MLLIFSACSQKEYSADEILKDWQEQGDKAPSLLEIQALCKKDVDTGHRDSTVCQVSRRANALIFQEKRKANFSKRSKN